MKIGEVKMGTAAYHAEGLDTIMYQDSGIYRNQQYGKKKCSHVKDDV